MEMSVMVIVRLYLVMAIKRAQYNSEEYSPEQYINIY